MDVDLDYDLGFNHEHEDRCKYVETNAPLPPTSDKLPCLRVMQLNIRGLLGKQEDLTRLIQRVSKAKKVRCNTTCGNLAQKINSEANQNTRLQLYRLP